MSEPGKPVPADVVAASYVELTVAIVALHERLGRLEDMFGDFLISFRAYLEALDDDDVTKH